MSDEIEIPGSKLPPFLPGASKDTLDSEETPFEAPLQERIVAGRYRLVDRIGSGGAGIVFKAEDQRRENELVAVKILAPIDFKDPTAKERFEKEVSLTKDFDHPNLVRVFDFGLTDTGQQYVVMEYVEGGTLAGRIYDTEKPLTFPEMLFILRDAARGVGVAHAQGIVHRDLKPDNILITREGVAKVADFGLAREIAAGTTITQSAETVGTPYYMSPEQFRNHRVDHRADIYSLGIIAFEMIAKRRPFYSEAYLELATSHARQPLPSFHEQAGVPKWVETFAIVCAEKTPELRYQSMEEVASYLERRMVRMELLAGDKGPWYMRALSRLLGES